MPPFSTEISEFRGNPILVVLCNGQPWGSTYPTDSEFQFGKTKALMILAIRDLLDEFNRTEGRDAARIQKEVPNAHGLTRRLAIQGFAGFNGPGDRFIEKPYLRLQCGLTSLSLGVNKAHALLFVWKDIEYFAS
jgi:hypothetical protein